MQMVNSNPLLKFVCNHIVFDRICIWCVDFTFNRCDQTLHTETGQLVSAFLVGLFVR